MSDRVMVYVGQSENWKSRSMSLCSKFLYCRELKLWKDYIKHCTNWLVVAQHKVIQEVTNVLLQSWTAFEL